MSTGTHPRKTATGMLLAVAAGVVLVLGLVVISRPTLTGNQGEGLDDAQVVATLQGVRGAYSDDLRAQLTTARTDPTDEAAAKAAARGLIDEGRAAGDSRLVGAALGILRPFLGAPDAEVLVIAATALQYQHDFEGALGLLDQAILIAPNDAGAILNRATIRVVLGEFAAAGADCRRLAAVGRIDLSLLCQAVAQTLTAQAPTVYARLEGIVAQGSILAPELETYATGLLGEIAMLQGWHDLARGHFAQVLARDPGDLRVRMMLADVLLSTGADQAALDALGGVPEVDGILVRRALAAGRLGDLALVERASAELARRFRQNIELGLTAHAREETRYFLEVAPDLPLALERAAVNWSLQREIEDAQLLIDAAMAAGEPAAAAPVLDWLAGNAVFVPTLRVPAVVRAAAP